MQLTNYASNVTVAPSSTLVGGCSVNIEPDSPITWSTISDWRYYGDLCTNSTADGWGYSDTSHAGWREEHNDWTYVNLNNVYNTLGYGNGIITINITPCEDESDGIDDHFAEDVDKMLEEYIEV